MRQFISLLVVALLCAGPVYADFFNDLAETIGDTAKRTVQNMAADMTEDLIRGMVVGYEVEQTRTGDDVLEDYKRDTGNRPAETFVSSYKSWMSPSSSVRVGQEVIIHSIVEVVPGSSGRKVVIEERLTIFDNENNSEVLTELTKTLGSGAGAVGELRGQFSFALPEGMPQGVYPVRTDILLDGEEVGDRAFQLQLVRVGDDSRLALPAQLLAVR